MCLGGKRSKGEKKLPHGKESKQLESRTNPKQMVQNSLKPSGKGILKKHKKGKIIKKLKIKNSKC